MKRALRINSLIGVGISTVLLLCILIGITDIPIIITVVLAYAIGLPIQFNKLIPDEEASMLHTGELKAVYGWRYWILFSLALILALICAMIFLAFFEVDDLGALAVGMAFAGAFISFVNPRYIKQELPNSHHNG